MREQTAYELDAMHERATSDITRVYEPVLDRQAEYEDLVARICPKNATPEAETRKLRVELRPYLLEHDWKPEHIDAIPLASLRAISNIRRKFDRLEECIQLLHEEWGENDATL